MNSFFIKNNRGYNNRGLQIGFYIDIVTLQSAFVFKTKNPTLSNKRGFSFFLVVRDGWNIDLHTFV